GPGDFVSEDLCWVAVLLPDWIVGLPYKRIIQLSVERVSVRPGDIAFEIGRSELNLAIGRDGARSRSGICASHTDFKRARSNFDSKRSVCLTAHADVVIHSDLRHQGGLGVVRAG